MATDNFPDTPSSKTLARAIEWAGTQQKLASLVGVSQTCIWSALHAGRVSAELAVAIDKATGGRFSRGDFRPDLWPSLQEGAPACA